MNSQLPFRVSVFAILATLILPSCTALGIEDEPLDVSVRLMRGFTEHHQRDLGLHDDKVSSDLWRGDIELSKGKYGAGLAVELVEPNDNLFSNANLSPTESDIYDVFGYISARRDWPEFRVLSKLGLYNNQLRQDIADGFEILNYDTIGVRLEMDTEYDLMRRKSFALIFATSVSVGAGYTDIDYNFNLGPKQDFDTSEVNYGVRTGFKFRSRGFEIEVAYLYKRTRYERSDVVPVSPTFGTFLQEIDIENEGVSVMMGFKF